PAHSASSPSRPTTAVRAASRSPAGGRAASRPRGRQDGAVATSLSTDATIVEERPEYLVLVVGLAFGSFSNAATRVDLVGCGFPVGRGEPLDRDTQNKGPLARGRSRAEHGVPVEALLLAGENVRGVAGVVHQNGPAHRRGAVRALEEVDPDDFVDQRWVVLIWWPRRQQSRGVGITAA